MAAELEAASNVDHFHAQDTAKFAAITTGLASAKTLLTTQDSQAAAELAKFMSMLADMDSRVALNILGQLPDIAMFARAALEDVAKGHDTTLASNARSMEMVHKVHTARLVLLKGELGRADLSADERRQLVNEVREVHADALAKDTENKVTVIRTRLLHRKKAITGPDRKHLQRLRTAITKSLHRK